MFKISNKFIDNFIAKLKETLNKLSDKFKTNGKHLISFVINI